MTTRRCPPRLAAVAALSVLSLLAGCASARAVSPGRLTPVKDRVTDEAIARDLALFDSYDRRVSAAAPNPSGAQKYLATRATEYVRIARDAYERNDRTAFVEDALAWAAADIETLQRNGAAAAMTSAVPMPKGTQRVGDALWTRAEALRRAAGDSPSSDAVALAEAQLMRAGYSFLAGPACLDEPPLVVAARLIDMASRTPIVVPPPTPIPVPAEPVSPEPAKPPPEQPKLPPTPRDCRAPERLVGVPTIVHFALDKSYLAPTTKEVLDRLIAALRPYPGIHVVLAGHTDYRAPDDYNQALSERRVNSVRVYLLSKGFAAERLDSLAFGEKRLLTPGHKVMDHARNRRVAITYTLCDGSEIQPVEGLSDIQLEAARRKKAASNEK